MTASNAVRFEIKPGRDSDFLGAHKNVHEEWLGRRRANIIKTGQDTYCLFAEWHDDEAIARARPSMIATLNSFRETLEELGSGGSTDAVSGRAVMTLK